MNFKFQYQTYFIDRYKYVYSKYKTNIYKFIIKVFILFNSISFLTINVDVPIDS